VLHRSGRVIKAALAAGFYPSLLRVDHPPARFRATEGGAVQVRVYAYDPSEHWQQQRCTLCTPAARLLGCGLPATVAQPQRCNMFSATAQVESSAVQVKFFERTKGRVFHHPASVNFDCGRFESGWLVYTDMVETSKVLPCSQHRRVTCDIMQSQPSATLLL
jgi:ATP-dependent RNA helicase DHX57